MKGEKPLVIVIDGDTYRSAVSLGLVAAILAQGHTIALSSPEPDYPRGWAEDLKRTQEQLERAMKFAREKEKVEARKGWGGPGSWKYRR